MIMEKVINQAQLLEEGLARYLKVSIWPPYPSRLSGEPGGQQDQEHGVVLHDQGEGYQPITTFPKYPSLKVKSQILYLNGVIMVSRAHNICVSGLDPIDCKSS